MINSGDSVSFLSDLRYYFPHQVEEDLSLPHDPIENTLDDLKNYLDNYVDEPKQFQYILSLVRLQIYQNPVFYFVESYKKFFESIKKIRTDIPELMAIDFKVSKYFPTEQLPSVQQLAKWFENKTLPLPENIFVMDPKKFKWNDYELMLRKIFNFYGKIPFFERILMHYPEFLLSYHSTFMEILTGDGPLPEEYRLYISILAIACTNCKYLYQLFLEKYLECGGEGEWIENFNKVPEKIQAFSVIIPILAFRPHILTTSEGGAILDQLLKGGKDNWTIQELLAAATIVTFFTSTSILVFGTGPMHNVGTAANISLIKALHSANSSFEMGESTPQLKFSSIQENKNEFILDLLKQEEKKAEEQEEEEKNNAPVEANVLAEEEESFLQSTIPNKIEKDGTSLISIFFPKYTKEKDTVSSKHVLKYSEYNWKMDGISLLGQLLPQLSKVLWEESDLASRLTFKSFACEKNVDTKLFRQSIWYCAEKYLGYIHDDFDYGKMNVVLQKNLKSFINKLINMPDSLNKSDFDIGYSLYPHEYLHILILVRGAKFDTTMLYLIYSLKKKLSLFLQKKKKKLDSKLM